MAKYDKNSKKTFLDYDKENDIIYIYQKGKFKGNVEIGDFILDLDINKKILGLEILNASENLKSLGITRNMLAHALKASLKVIYRKNSVLIGFALALPQKVEKKALIAMPALR